jgi:hypothetical protein
MALLLILPTLQQLRRTDRMTAPSAIPSFRALTDRRVRIKAINIRAN